MTTRRDLIREAHHALAVAREGHYLAPSGQRVELGPVIAASIAGTVDHPGDVPVAPALAGRFDTRIDVIDDTSLAAAHRLARDGSDVLVHNFANALHPGGGFLNGAIAQEESLVRSSTLHAAIAPSPMYAFHARGDAFYSDWAIWSPAVPVFRDDRTGELLERPWRASFLTAAAPMAFEIRRTMPSRAAELPAVLRRRIVRSLEIAALHGHTKLVLGAWGCGAFGNDTEVVAEIYKEELAVLFAGVFEAIVFAVLDRTAERRYIGPFTARFC